MKKALLLLMIVSTSFLAKSQAIELLDANGNSVIGDTLVFNHLYDTTVFNSDFEHKNLYVIVNNSSGTMNIDLVRTEIMAVPGTGDYFCWGTQCLGERQAGSKVVWTANDPVITAAGDTAGGIGFSHYFAHHNKFGNALYKFTYVDQNNPSNSASIYFKYQLRVSSAPIEILDYSGNSLLGDTIKYTEIINNTNRSFDFERKGIAYIVNNTFDKNMDIDIIRTEIDTITGTGDYYCWGTSCFIESAAGSQAVWEANDPVLGVQAGDTASGTQALSIYLAHNQRKGVAIYKYEFIDENDRANNKGSFFVKWNIEYTVGLNENEKDAYKFTVSPNPVKGDVAEIRFANALNFDNQYVVVYDLSGKEVEKLNVSKGVSTIKLNTSTYNSGLYFVRLVANGTSVMSRKIIVE